MKKHSVPYDSDIFDAKKKHGLSDGETVMLYALRKYASERNKGWCWPKQKDLAKILCCEDRTVRNRLKHLEACRLIEVEKRISTKKEGVQYNAYRFINWWSSDKPESGKSVPQTGKFIPHKAENSCQKDGTDFPVNHIMESSKKKQKPESSPPTPPRGLEEEKKTLSKNPNNQTDMVSSARRSGRSMARRDPLVQKLAELKKSEYELFMDVTKYAQEIFEKRRYNIKLSHERPIKQEHEKEYMVKVACNALWGPKDKREALEKWRRAKREQPKRKWVTVEEMMGHR